MNLKPALIGVLTLTALGILLHHTTDTATVTPASQLTPITTTGAATPSPPAATSQSSSTMSGSTGPVEGWTGESSGVPGASVSYRGDDITGPIDDAPAGRGALATTRTFIAGWLEADPGRRAAQLRPVATAALAEQLAIENLRIWNVSLAGDPTLVVQLDTTISTRQHFTDGRSVDLLLIAEPSAPDGWIVTDIQPTRPE